MKIRAAIREIEEFRPASPSELAESSRDWLAIPVSLHAIGGFLSQIRSIDEDVVDSPDSVLFLQVIGLRDRISHGYDRINSGINWHTITSDLSALRSVVDRLETRLMTPNG